MENLIIVDNNDNIDYSQLESINSSFVIIPLVITALSTLVTMAVFYFSSSKNHENSSKNGNSRSATLPGYGILGDKVNEFIEVFLDALAIYVHNTQNEKNWDCSRRMLCEANQRAGEYGTPYGILMYFLSLSVSFLLQDQRVSDSMEAMRRGRHGIDCITSYPHCPFSL